MFIVGSAYWNMVYRRKVGEVENDVEGMTNIENPDENMALLKILIIKRFIEHYYDDVDAIAL
jgi:hypothetical protein